MRRLLAVAGATLALGAAAQQTALPQSEAVACMTPTGAERGLPEYPKEMLARRDEGQVEVQLTFTEPDSPPRLRLLENSGGGAFEGSVRSYVSRYRVPCLAAGQTATIRQVFNFVWRDVGRVSWSTPVDEDEARQRRLARCLTSEPGPKPAFPLDAARRGVEGVAVLGLSFSSAQLPPQLKVLNDGGHARFVSVASEHALRYRLPCHDGREVSIIVLYHFRLGGGSRSFINDMTLPTLVRATAEAELSQAYFDTQNMGCPFDLKVTLLRPYAPNRVAEIGEPNPSRMPLIDWLSRQSLKLPERAQQRATGNEFLLHVPCVVLDLSTSSGGTGTQ